MAPLDRRGLAVLSYLYRRRARLRVVGGESMTTTPTKKVKLKLVGLDGNVFCLIGAFRRQARREKWTDEEIEAVTEDAMSGDYSHAVATLMEHCKGGGM